jgi:hypothetical protein
VISLSYISHLMIDAVDRANILDEIQSVAIARNSMLDITGVLIATKDYFGQLLEGPAAAVAIIMGSIYRDPRHRDLRIVRNSIIETRRYPKWRMERFDWGNFGDATITPVLVSAYTKADQESVQKLDRLFEAVAKDQVLTVN